MSAQEVIIRRVGATGRITLNRPQVLHALSTTICVEMTKALLAWREDDAVERILIDHAPDTRGFCGGGDVLMLIASLKEDGKAAVEFFTKEYRLNALLQGFPKPVLAIMDGVVMGGGVGVSAHGTYRIITERSLFAMPEAGIGLFPDVGGSWLLSRLAGGLGFWLALTGARLRGKDVLGAGIGTHFIESGDIPAFITTIEQQGLAALDGLETRAELSFADKCAQIDKCFLAPDVEESVARLAQDGSAWAETQLEAMRKNCPISMKTAHRQVREGAKMETFKEVMQMEYRIARRIIFQPNFQEGVRALLVDKDQNPQWQPATLEQVSQTMLDEIFAPLGADELQFL